MIAARDDDGNLVVCSDWQWATKIVANHPELTGRELDVQLALARPSYVLQDRDYSDRRHFVLRLPSGLLLDVVVEYDYAADAPEGTIVTAFERERLRRGDIVIRTTRRR